MSTATKRTDSGAADEDLGQSQVSAAVGDERAMTERGGDVHDDRRRRREERADGQIESNCRPQQDRGPTRTVQAWTAEPLVRKNGAHTAVAAAIKPTSSRRR